MGSPTSSAKSYTTLCQLLDSKQIVTPASRAQPSHTRASRGITCVSRGTKVLSMSSSTFSNPHPRMSFSIEIWERREKYRSGLKYAMDFLCVNCRNNAYE